MPSRKPHSGLGTRSPRVTFAAELSRLRAESGLSLRELAERVGWDHTHLHGMERGRTLGGPEVAEALDTMYGTTPFLLRLWELAQQGAAFRDKYKRYMELEKEAIGIENYASSYLPGLLQTADYARALLWSTPHDEEHEAALEEQLAARMDRAELLHRDKPPFLRTILDEAVLRRPLPNRHAWRTQLQHLVELAGLHQVTVQVLPCTTGPHDLLGGSLTILRRDDGRTAAWLESSKSGELFDDAREAEKRFRLSYDAVRDAALSPRDSLVFIQQVMEDSAPCDPPAST